MSLQTTKGFNYPQYTDTPDVPRDIYALASEIDNYLTTNKGSQGVQGTQGVQGAQGPQGTQGVQGVQGTQGVQGAQGVQGKQGLQGIQGPAGQGIQGPAGSVQGTQGLQGFGYAQLQGVQGTAGASGYYTLSATPPSSPATGSAWINSNDGRTYIYDGTEWYEPYDNLSGLQGPTGTQGSQGTTGNTGSQGSVGLQGTQGIQGIQGNQGIQGIQGIYIPLGVSLVSGSSYRSLGITGTATATNNQTFYTPFFVPNSVTLNQLACITSSSFSGSASVRLGIYNDNNGLPNTVLLDAGTVSPVSSSTLYGITISQSLSPGIYWLASNVITSATTNNYVGFATGIQTQIVGMPVVTVTSTANGTAFGYTESVNASSGFTTAGTLSVPASGTSPLVQVKVQ